jgi:hypothetical protein
MYALHQLSRKYPDFLISEENEERVKDFRLRFEEFILFKKEESIKFHFRLRYLYRGASSYTTQLKNALNGKSEGDEQDEQVC